jgi:hypothetical protein
MSVGCGQPQLAYEYGLGPRLFPVGSTVWLSTLHPVAKSSNDQADNEAPQNRGANHHASDS